MIDLDYLRSIGAVIRLQGREYLTHPGLLRVAHENGLKSIETELLSWDREAWAAVVRARVVGERGIYTGLGDASPENVGKQVVGATLRMAETRAINRGLRLYTGLGMTTTDELPGDAGSEPLDRPAPPPHGSPDAGMDADVDAAFKAVGLDPAQVRRWIAAAGRPPMDGRGGEYAGRVAAYLAGPGAPRLERWLRGGAP